MAETMRAWMTGLGADWVQQEIEVPQPGTGEVLLRMRAVGLNRADLSMLAGRYNRPADAPPVYVGGIEGAGEVVAIGDGVDRLSIGDRVMGSVRGALSPYAVIDARLVGPAPDGVSWAQAAALPVGLNTEHDALVTQAGFTAGQSVLILGGTSSVGLIGIQMAKALGASVVLASTTNDGKAQALRDAGADVVVNTSTDDVAATVLGATAGAGVDVVLDHLAGQPLADVLPAVRIQGTIINIGRLAGRTSSMDIETLAFRRIRLQGTTFSVRTADERAEVVDALAHEVLPAVTAGKIRPIVDRVFPFDEAVAAADYMRSNQAVGKIVVEI